MSPIKNRAAAKIYSTLIQEKTNFILVDKLFKHVPVGWISGALLGYILFSTLNGTVNENYLIGWCVSLFASYFLIFLLYVAYKIIKPAQDQMKLWDISFSILLILCGFIWGSAAFLAFFIDDPVTQCFILLFLFTVTTGMAQGSIGNLKISIPAVILTILPITIFSIYLDNNIVNKMGYLSILLMSFLLFSTYVNTKLQRQAIALSLELNDKNDELNRVNDTLEQKVRARTKDLEFQAKHDNLTKLPNQTLLFEYVKTAIEESKINGTTFGIACLSIKNLELIIDSYGYQTANKLVKMVASELQILAKHKTLQDKLVNYIITLSRRDEFVILISPLLIDRSKEQISQFFDLLERNLAEKEFYIQEEPFRLDISIGVSLYPKDGEDVDTLLMNADAAKTYAKKQFSLYNYILYEPHINNQAKDTLKLSHDLRVAVKRQEFLLQYQPIIDVNKKRVSGVEALVRWKHPKLGIISPDRFIPLAEATGLITPLTEWVLYTACRQIKLWHEEGFPELQLSVNLSAIQLKDDNVFELINTVLKTTKLESKYLELELTETEAFKTDVVHKLKELTRRGIDFAIDDYGTGYSGLSNLKLFPIKKIKIDKNFVHDITTNNHSRAIVASNIALAKELNIIVLAEGVESISQLKFLMERKCDMIQGFLFSRALDPESCYRFLKEIEKINNIFAQVKSSLPKLS